MKTTDVAFSTDKNRIALRGAVNIRNQRFEDLNFALVNPYGCSVFQQSINGPFDSPDVSNVRVVKAIFGPVKNLFKRKKCKEVFYNGSVEGVTIQ